MTRPATTALSPRTGRKPTDRLRRPPPPKRRLTVKPKMPAPRNRAANWFRRGRPSQCFHTGHFGLMSLARRRMVQIIGTLLYSFVGLRLLHFKNNFQMPHCIPPPAKGLALRSGDPRDARVASGVIKSLGKRTTQRLRIARRHNADQTRETQ